MLEPVRHPKEIYDFVRAQVTKFLTDAEKVVEQHTEDNNSARVGDYHFQIMITPNIDGSPGSEHLKAIDVTDSNFEAAVLQAIKAFKQKNHLGVILNANYSAYVVFPSKRWVELDREEFLNTYQNQYGLDPNFK